MTRFACAADIKKNLNWVADVPGDVAEIGVFEGASAKIISEVSGRFIHLFDTCSGHPDCLSGVDGDKHKPGGFCGSEKAIRKAMDGREYKLYIGVFPDTAVDIPNGLSFVHVDVDLYKSTIDALRWADSLINPGGVIMCDDATTNSCPGAIKAWEDWSRECRDRYLFGTTGRTTWARRHDQTGILSDYGQGIQDHD